MAKTSRQWPKGDLKTTGHLLNAGRRDARRPRPSISVAGNESGNCSRAEGSIKVLHEDLACRGRRRSWGTVLSNCDTTQLIVTRVLSFSSKTAPLQWSRHVFSLLRDFSGRVFRLTCYDRYSLSPRHQSAGPRLDFGDYLSIQSARRVPHDI
jgi:hypothetical protein